MKVHHRVMTIIPVAVVFAVLLAGALLLTATPRTPALQDGQYVGQEQCAACHEETVAKFRESIHGQKGFEKRSNHSCETWQHGPRAELGIVLNLTPASPASASKPDREAARRFDGSFNRWYLDPLFRGRYPEDAIAERVRRGHLSSPDLPFVQAGDLEAIAAPLDFLGVNYYSRVVVRADAAGAPVAVPVPPQQQPTDMGWEAIFPQGLHDLAVRIHREYAPDALYVTENGAAFDSPPAAGEPAADARRIDFVRSHLQAAHRAIADGVPLAGYFHWSLIDNFEWQHGYTKRFGLVWVDYPTQRRVPKGSARWYREVVCRQRHRRGRSQRGEEVGMSSNTGVRRSGPGRWLRTAAALAPALLR